MIDKQFLDYAESFTSEESTILKELTRETNLKMLFPRMISGKIQGKMLSMISYMLKPSRILEIGTYTGYSAICLALGLDKQGFLTTIDKNPEVEIFANKYFTKSNLQNKINLIIGNAKDIIPNLTEIWDLVYLDADKENYVNYYSQLFHKIKIGGYLIADNVFWNGKVLDSKMNTDKETQGIIAFNNLILNDNRVEQVFLPLRDGLMIIRKISE